MKSKTLLPILFSLCFASCLAQDNRIHQLDSIFSALYSSGDFNGNVLIAENGKPLYKKSFGFANQQNQQRLDANSLLLLGSVSKQFTAFGIVLLREEGRLDYDDNIKKFMPELPYEGITIRHLLTHTSGIADYSNLMKQYWNRSGVASNQEVLRMLVKHHPAPFFTPGARYEYSNTGYVLLTLLIEKLSGNSYQEFMDERIFKPAGMNRTIVYNHYLQSAPATDQALEYVYHDSLYQYVMSGAAPACKETPPENDMVEQEGISSTVSDLLIWDQLLYSNKLAPASSIEEIFTPATVQNGRTDYGFGWHVKSLRRYGKVAYHSGGWPGHIAYIERHIDSKKTIIILRNGFTPEIQVPMEQIRSILYGGKISAIAAVKNIPVRHYSL